MESSLPEIIVQTPPTIIPLSSCAYVTNSMSPAMGNNFLSNTSILSEMSKYLLENIFNSNLMQPLYVVRLHFSIH